MLASIQRCERTRLQLPMRCSAPSAGLIRNRQQSPPRRPLASHGNRVITHRRRSIYLRARLLRSLCIVPARNADQDETKAVSVCPRRRNSKTCPSLFRIPCPSRGALLLQRWRFVARRGITPARTTVAGHPDPSCPRGAQSQCFPRPAQAHSCQFRRRSPRPRNAAQRL
jgi:hypothetical protein